MFTQFIGNKQDLQIYLISSFMPLFRTRISPVKANILSYEMDLLKNFKGMWPLRNQTNVFKVARKIFIIGWKHSAFPPRACISPLMKCTVQSDGCLLDWWNHSYQEISQMHTGALTPEKCRMLCPSPYLKWTCNSRHRVLSEAFFTDQGRMTAPFQHQPQSGMLS